MMETVCEVENDSDSESSTFVFGQVLRGTLSDIQFDGEDNLGDILFLKPELTLDMSPHNIERIKTFLLFLLHEPSIW